MPEELDIRVSEDFKRLADQLQDAIYHYDVASRTFIFMNKSSGRLLDYDDSEFARVVTPKTILLHIHPEDREAVRKASADSLKPGFERGEIEYRFLHPDGSVRWMHDRWVVLRDASGAAKAIEGIVRDITRLKETEKALLEYERRFRRIAEMSPFPISVIDDQGRYLYVNRKFIEIFGYTLEDIPTGGEWFRRAFPDAEYRRQARAAWISDMKAGAQCEVDPREFRVTCKDGTVRYVRFRPVVIEDDTLFIMYEDLTERKQAEKEIRRLSRELISTQEVACKRLAQDLHDECGQALTALHLGMEALRGSLPREFEKQKKRIQELTGIVERLGDTIRNISHELRPEMLDDLGLVPALAWYIKEFMRRAPGLDVDFKALGFKKRLDPALEIALYRMVQEGLTNIARHAGARHAEVILTLSHPNVILTVKDDGVGLGDVSSASHRGIGLLGMRERVASLGGSIEIRSGRGKGTVLRAELPLEARHICARYACS
ncbi:MAG: PAS domain S-box protein [Deltaproteobacteria bacterium]|nr:PAS domain S-box protein [Deltaproteobacteria bacterium]